MNHRFVVSLTVQARRSRPRVDLASYIEERFHDEVRVLERGYGGKSVTVEMADSFVPKLQDQLPFATVAPDVDLKLLSYP